MSLLPGFLSPSRNLGTTLMKTYSILGGTAAGRWLFSLLVGKLAPYTGSIGAVVTALQPKYAVVRLADSRRVRNHLKSIHAMALANLGEMATGLALVTALPDDTKCILVGYEITYTKKARGTLTAVCTISADIQASEAPYEVRGRIRNSKDETVATITARWLVSADR